MRLGLLVILVAIAGRLPQQPIFRARTELVRIDVLVERNGRPIVNLDASDFIVEDNGVRQHVTLMPVAGAVTVSTVLDVSGSMTAEKLDHAAAAIRLLTTALHDRDRHVLFAFASNVRQILAPVPRDSVSTGLIASAIRDASGSHTSLCDALYAAIMQGELESGPKMVMVVTDGRNNTSWLSAQAVIDAAIRHESIVYPIAVRQDARQYPADVPPMAGDDGLRLLEIFAARTGGRVVNAEWSRDLGSVLGSIIGEYRQRYILTFVPEGVGTQDGWHRLNVKLLKRSGTVHARSGYWSR